MRHLATVVVMAIGAATAGEGLAQEKDANATFADLAAHVALCPMVRFAGQPFYMRLGPANETAADMVSLKAARDVLIGSLADKSVNQICADALANYGPSGSVLPGLVERRDLPDAAALYGILGYDEATDSQRDALAQVTMAFAVGRECDILVVDHTRVGDFMLRHRLTGADIKEGGRFFGQFNEEVLESMVFAQSAVEQSGMPKKEGYCSLGFGLFGPNGTSVPGLMKTK